MSRLQLFAALAGITSWFRFSSREPEKNKTNGNLFTQREAALQKEAVAMDASLSVDIMPIMSAYTSP
jgi:hypothetical protein